MRTQKPIIIIGGGITGLAAAWELQQQHPVPPPYMLLESDSRWGGKINTATHHLDGGEFIIDGGPESFITRKPEVWDLAHEAGLAEMIQPIGGETSHMYVLDRGRPTLVPMNPLAFAASPLMSLGGKLRMLGEPFVPARRDDGDESLADFVTRRLGKEALDQFIGPILAGIYNTDPYRQSILTSSPIMREMEAEYGGLFKALVGRMRKARAERAAGGQPQKPRFITFQRGAQGLVEGLLPRLTGELRLNAPVQMIEADGSEYRVHLNDGRILEACAVILAVPANCAAEMLPPGLSAVTDELRRIRHDNIGTVSLIYRRDHIPNRQVIHGLMIPRREKRRIDAVQFTSLKFDNRSPAGYHLLRVFFGGGDPALVEIDEAQMLEAVRSELCDLLGISAAPLEAVAFRWPHSFPQADVGHLERIAALQQHLPPGLALAGSSYHGIGVPDCIRDGRNAARMIQSYL